MTGRVRRPVPERPGPGQESVWDYPRPPALEESRRSIQVVLGGVTVADTTRSWRVLETSHPPTYYLPREAWRPGALREAAGSSFCEWKGRASYLDVVGGPDDDPVIARQAAWFYPDPSPRFVAITGAVAVMPAAVDRCVVDGQVVRPQQGGFYGGWITDDLAGPFKGGPGSMGW